MLKSKTLWTGVSAITAAVGAFFMEEIQFGEMLQIIVTSALAVFLRHGVKKAEKAAEGV
tara:strand:+ start:56 stop:232 length:177 start_codon:yes stop_codon:yes gene_type:complete